MSVSATYATEEWPRLRPGRWHFVRTFESFVGPILGVKVPSSFESKQEATRCVDPNLSMQMTFHSGDVGHCHSQQPIVTGNRFVFPVRCDYSGPVRTEVQISSADTYTEMHDLAIGRRIRRETVTARRIDDCETTGSISGAAGGAGTDMAPGHRTGPQ
jgi:hypothetical protein